MLRTTMYRAIAIALFGSAALSVPSVAATHSRPAIQRIHPIATSNVIVNSWQDSILYAFQGGRDGNGPVGGVVADANGALYGTTFAGGGSLACVSSSGPLGCGTVFKLTPTGSNYTESVLHRFKGGSDGAAPWAPLVAGPNGIFYGTAQHGGNSTACTNASIVTGCGTVFEVKPTKNGYKLRTLYAFAGGNDGEYPLGALMIDNSGALYGTTEYGGNGPCSENGQTGCGIVFKLTPNDKNYIETVLYGFQGGTDGAFPYGFLIADAKGALYSTTRSGGRTRALPARIHAERCSN